MIAALVLIAGKADFGLIVQAPVVALYPASVVGTWKSMVFVAPTVPLTWAFSCELSDETASVPSETSIASRRDRAASEAASSAVVSTVITDRSWRSPSRSSEMVRRRRAFGGRVAPLMPTLPLILPERVRPDR